LPSSATVAVDPIAPSGRQQQEAVAVNTQHRITSGLAVTVALTLAAGAPAALANPTQQLYGPAGRPTKRSRSTPADP